MPFEELPTPSIIHTGPPSRNDFVIVRMSTGTRLAFNTYRHRYGDKRFELARDTWPKQIRDQVEEVSSALRRRGRPPHASDFSAVLKTDEVLAIGRPVVVTVIYGRSAHHEYDVRLRGTPVEFSFVHVPRE